MTHTPAPPFAARCSELGLITLRAANICTGALPTAIHGVAGGPRMTDVSPCNNDCRTGSERPCLYPYCVALGLAVLCCAFAESSVAFSNSCPSIDLTFTALRSSETCPILVSPSPSRRFARGVTVGTRLGLRKAPNLKFFPPFLSLHQTWRPKPTPAMRATPGPSCWPVSRAGRGNSNATGLGLSAPVAPRPMPTASTRSRGANLPLSAETYASWRRG